MSNFFTKNPNLKNKKKNWGGRRGGVGVDVRADEQAQTNL